MVQRKRLWIGLLILTMVSVLAAPALAVISYGARIQGENDFTSVTTTTAALHGLTRVGGIYSTPNKIDCQLQLFKNGTLVSSRSWPLVNATMTGGDLDGSSAIPGSWQGYGWHYAYWAEELFTDTCTTYPTPGSRAMAAAENTALVEFAMDDETLEDTRLIGYYQTSDVLKEALGQQKGTALDVVLHQDLSQYLRIGDTIPGVALSAKGDKATVLFFHDDGSTTRVDVVCENDVWIVKEVREVWKK